MTKIMRRQYTIRRCKVKDLSTLTVHPYRAGVILYTSDDQSDPSKIVDSIIEGDKSVKFMLGIDSKSGELTDFGGGVKYRRDKDAIGGALREFHEETLNIFRSIDREMISDCFTFFDNQMMIVFIGIRCDLTQACDIFRSEYEKKKFRSEIKSIMWISYEEFINIITKKRSVNKSDPSSHLEMFSLVRKFLSKCDLKKDMFYIK